MYTYIMLHTIKPTYLMTVYCLRGAASIGLWPNFLTYFLSKPSSMLCVFFSFEIGWRDEKLGVKVVSPRNSA